jgi:phosphatidylinositol alpha-mannosyltransferase
VFCAPSLHGESFGIVLLEAMAATTPVVASNLDGYQNVATHEVDALLVEPGRSDELAAALSRVLDDESLAHRLVEAGQARAREHSMDELAARYEVLYRRALDIEAAAGSAVRVPRMLKRFEGRFLRGSRERTRVT